MRKVDTLQRHGWAGINLGVFPHVFCVIPDERRIRSKEEITELHLGPCMV